MDPFVRPRVVISRCLGFEHCRFNGEIIRNKIVERLSEHVEAITPCPEVDIGLGVPRDAIRLVTIGGKVSLYQPATGRDLTDGMKSYINDLFAKLPEVDGFLLKSRSPSCGTGDVKLYGEDRVSPVTGKESGFFGGAVIERYSHLPIETEGRLLSYSIREHFLTRIFLIAKFRELRDSFSMKSLVDFHSRNKLLYMAYNQKEMRLMGRVVANQEKKSAKQLIEDYSQHFFAAIEKSQRYTSNINVLMHALGYFSDSMSRGEKAYFLDTLERYRNGKVPLSVPISLVKTYVIKHGIDYLLNQSFLEPYPEDLVVISDSGKGRDL